MNFFIIFTLASIISCTGANLDPNHKGIELEIPSESKQKKITSKKNYLNYIKVFYKDTVSVFGKVVERELETIGDDDIWSKPSILDIEVGLSLNNYKTGIVQISIEELFSPQNKLICLDSMKGNLKEPTWVPHNILFSNSSRNLSSKIELEQVNYKTAYFISSHLYKKQGFRICATFVGTDCNELEHLKKEYYYE